MRRIWFEADRRDKLRLRAVKAPKAAGRYWSKPTCVHVGMMVAFDHPGRTLLD
jgi:hypothetical protein